MTKGSGSARLRRARFALSSLSQRSSGLFREAPCRARKTPDCGEAPAGKTPPAVVGFASFRLTFEALPGAARRSGAGRSPARRARLCRAPDKWIVRTEPRPSPQARRSLWSRLPALVRAGFVPERRTGRAAACRRFF